MPTKHYKILKTHNNKNTIIEGSLHDIEQHFKPLLHLGNHHNHLIQTSNYRGIKPLIKNIEESLLYKEQNHISKTTIELIH